MKKSTVANNQEMCCGCGACVLVCPVNAVSLELSAKGYNIPVIDERKCVQCGKCLKVCNFKSFAPTGEKPACYAVRHIDEDEVLTSRSGGFFMAVCQHVTEHHGVVCGCQLDEKLRAKHVFCDTYEACKKFKGSKYVQSDLGNTFIQCADFLRAGRMVLFSGTGCQIHGLISYLDVMKVPRANLITMDIVCHGAPSPGVWNTFLKVFQENEDIIVTHVDYRDKQVNGWADHVEKYSLLHGGHIHAKRWTYIYYRHIMFRESCYRCPYTTAQRNSDFTIGDYWGIGKNVPQYDDNKGCSLVLVHSEQGNEVLKAVRKNINCIETRLENSLQPQLVKPIWKGWDYGLFWRSYIRNPERAVRIWFFSSGFMKLVFSMEAKAKNVLRRICRKVLHH